MTKVFLYEFVTGGGWWSVDPECPPAGSILNEALVMIRSVAEDFASLPGVEVSALCDARLASQLDHAGDISHVSAVDQEQSAFAASATRADYVLVLAPEFDGHLLKRVCWAEALGCALISPHRPFVEIASDKHRTAELLRQSGIAAPRGMLYSTDSKPPPSFQWPAVLKPRDGAGSIDVRLVSSWTDLPEISEGSRILRLEEYCPGIPASVALLCSPVGNWPLVAGRQLLSSDGRFRYLGCQFPLDEELQVRAVELARSAAGALPRTIGYVGFDLILGDERDGSRDYVIEVNPRLTTSYVGLRQLCRQNLAGAMLAIARGETIALSFERRGVRFELPRGSG